MGRRGRRGRRSGRREAPLDPASKRATSAPGAANAAETTRGGSPPTDPDVTAADRYGTLLAALFGIVGIFLVVLAATGRGWPYWLGAADFLAIAAVLAWVRREGRRASS